MYFKIYVLKIYVSTLLLGHPQCKEIELKFNNINETIKYKLYNL